MTATGSIVTTVDIAEDDIKVYAIWSTTIENVDLIFDANGGEDRAGNTEYVVPVPINSTQVLADRQPSGNDEFRNEGYRLLGWSLSPNGAIVTTVEIVLADVTVYAIWSTTYEEVKLIFDANGGEDRAGNTEYSADVPINSTQILADWQPTGIDEFRNEGYRLLGWSLSANGQIVTTVDILLANVRVYAIWSTTYEEVKLIFDANGGEDRAGNTEYSADVPINSTQILADWQPTGNDEFRNEGYRLLGWSLSANGQIVTTVDILLANVRVYAIWSTTYEEVKLIFDANGGEDRAGNTEYSADVPINSTQILADWQPTGIDEFRFEGYRLLGWALTANGSPVATVDILEANVRVYAVWTVDGDSVNLIFDANGGEDRAGNTEYSVEVPINSTQTLATWEPTGNDEFRNAGYRLLGWSLTATGSIVTTVDIAEEDVKVYAIWSTTIENVDLIFDANGGEDRQGNTEYSVEVPINSTQNLADWQPTGNDEFRNAGYRLLGWSLSPNGQIVTTVDIVLDDVKVYAIWSTTIENVDLIFDANGGEDRQGNTEYSVEVPINSTQTLADWQPTGNDEFRNAGYRLLGWSLTANGQIVTTVDIVLDDVKVYAIWSTTYEEVDLIFDANGGVDSQGNTEYSVEVPINSTQILADWQPTGSYEFKNDGYRLLGWSLSANGQIVTTVDILLADVKVYAIWSTTYEEVNLIFDANGGEDRAGNTEFVVPVPIYSTQVLADWQPAGNDEFRNEGYRFIGWTFTANSTVAITTVNIYDDDVRVYAIWEFDGEAVSLIFDANGGADRAGNTEFRVDVPINSTQVLAARQPVYPNDFRNAGYRLLGWSLTANGAIVTSVDIDDEDVRVYAIWSTTIEYVDLIFDANGGVDRQGNTEYIVEVPINSTQTLATWEPTGNDEFRNAGYRLLGWSFSPNGAIVTTVDIVLDDVKVYAIWSTTIENVDLIYDANGGEDRAGNTEYVVPVPINSTQILADWQPTGNDEFRNEGYRLLGWSLSPNGAIVTTVDIVLDDVKVYAIWSTVYEEVDLIFDANGGMDRQGNTEYSVEVPINSTQILADWQPTGNDEFRFEGYRLLGWSRSPNGQIVTSVDIFEIDVRVYAVWTIDGDAVNLIFDANGGEDRAGNTEYSVEVPINSTQLLATWEPTGNDEFRNAGYRLLGWSLTANGAIVTTVDILEVDVRVYAIWSTVYEEVNLIFDANGGEDRQGNTEYSVDVPINSTQTLADWQPTGNDEFRNAGFRLLGWSLSPNGSIVTTVDIVLDDVKVYAIWTSIYENVNLIFDANGGADRAGNTEYVVQVLINSTQTLADRQPIDNNEFRNAGYRLLGWSLSPNGAIVTTVDIVLSDVRVYAIWSTVYEEVYLIFDANGGEDRQGNTEYSVEVPINSTQVLADWQPVNPNNFRNAGYRLIGWSLSVNGPPVTSVDILLTDVRVYAIWSSEDEVNLIFDANGGEDRAGNTEYVVQVLINSTHILANWEPTYPNDFRNAGRRLLGWSLSANGPIVTTVDIFEADIRVYAIWSIDYITVHLIFDANGGEDRAGNTEYEVFVPENSTQILADRQPTGDFEFRNAGHRLVGWSLSANGSIVTTVDIAEVNVRVYAIWEEVDDVLLIFDANGGEDRSGNTVFTVEVPVNSTQNLAARQPTYPNDFRYAGHRLIGWSLTVNGSPVTTVDILEADVTVYAIWEEGDDVPFVFNGNGGENAAGNDTYTVTVPINSTQTLALIQPTGADAFILEGHYLAGWSLTPNGQAVTTVDIAEAIVTVYAIWAEGQPITVTFHGNGGVNTAGGNTYTRQVPINSTYEIADLEPTGDAAYIRLGYDQLGWTLVANDESTLFGQYIYFGEADVNVYAFWSDGPIYINLTFDGNGDAANTNETVQILKHSNVTLADYAPQGLVKAGAGFDGWSSVANNAATRLTTIARLVDNTTVYALWTDYERSDTPNIDPIEEGDRIVTGQGVPGSRIDVTWPDDSETFTTVDAGGNWAISVPAGLDLEVDDVVTAIQTETNKMPSLPAQETVGGGDQPGNGKSDTPDIDVIRAGDQVVTGRGTAGSTIEVAFEGVAAPVIVTVQPDDTWSADVPSAVTLVEGDIVMARQTTDPKDPSDWAQSTVIDDTMQISDTPNINPIRPGDRYVRGEGVPGADIEVTWPDGTTVTNVTVDPYGFWTATVPDDIDMVVNDVVTAVQTETDKLPSVPAHETVGGGDLPGDGKSDTPDIDVIYAGADIVTGTGTAGSYLLVRFPGNRFVDTTVGPGDRWSVNVPAGLNLVVGDEVFALQKTGDKDPSDWAQRTVIDISAQEISDTPNIDPITEGDSFITGQGVPGSTITVTFPGGVERDTDVDAGGNWAVDVPATVDLVEGDVVSAVQTEYGKLPSVPAQETVGGGDIGTHKSDTPDIDVIREGDRTVKGRGTAGSTIFVRFPGVINLIEATVDSDDNWSVNVPPIINLVEDDVVYAQQVTGDKDPSDWAQRTVIGDTQLVSDTPIINRIRAGARIVTGEGIPGADIVVTWPDGTTQTTVTVDVNGNWTAQVPATVTLVLDNVVTAVQTEPGKLPSVPAQETVGGGGRPGNGRSDTPDIFVIYAGDDTISGVGVEGSTIVVRFPDNSTVRVTVGANDLWTADVPAGIILVAGDEVFAMQVTPGKRPSEWAQRTVIDEPTQLRSDTPNIDPIMEGDSVVSGQGVPGATITVEWPGAGALTTDVTVNAQGNWTAVVPAAIDLVEGDVVSAVQTEDGKLPSLPATETVGGEPVGQSDTPDIDVIYEGDTVITGRGTPGSLIAVKLPNWSDQVYATVGANSLWSVNVPAALDLVKDDVVFAQQITGTLAPSDWVQTTVIDRPTELLSDTPNINPIKEGAAVVTGEGVPEAEIEVVWPDGQGSTTTTVGASGNWSVTVPASVDLVAGDVVTAYQTETGKLRSLPATETVGGEPVEYSDTPDIDEIYEGDTVITGNGTPGSRIRVRLPDGRIRETTVGPDGRWTLELPDDVDLVAGDEIFAQQITDDNEPSEWAQRTVRERPTQLVSDTPNIDPITAGDSLVTGQGVPGASIVVTWPNNGGSTTVTVRASGNWTATVPTSVTLVAGDVVIAVQNETGKLPSEPATEVVGGVPSGKSDTPDINEIFAGDRTVTGRGAAGSRIQVKFPNNEVVDVTVNANGVWQAAVPASVDLEAGDIVYAQQTTGTNEPSEWAQRTVVDRPARDRSDTPNINPIDKDDTSVTGEGVPGARIEVLWPDNTTTATTVNNRGNWIVTVPNSGLEPGDVVTAVQIEPGKDPSWPAHETVTGAKPKDDESDTPDIDIIYENDDTVSGWGVAGSEIIVRFPDGRTVSTTVGTNDRWSVNVPAGLTLAVGDVVEAMQRTLDYDPSEWASQTVRARTPLPIISDTPNINPVNEGDKAVTGEGVPGATVEVTWPDGSTTVVDVDPNGNWTAPVPPGVKLEENDVITAVQNEGGGKLPSEPAHVTVGGGEKPGDGKSDTPNIDDIVEGDRVVNGNGVPGSEIIVRFENNAVVRTTVQANRLWSVNVPASVNLEEGDIVLAVQITGDKGPSDEAQRTVLGAPRVVLSDTPNIDPIKETDKSVTGKGVPGADIVVTWPDGSTTETKVGPDGNWAVSVPPDVTLEEGDIITAVQKEPGKPDSLPAHETVNGDKTTGPGNDGKSDTPDIDVIYVGATRVTGRGTPGSEVAVKFRNGETVNVIVGQDSTWSVNVPTGISMNEGDLVFAQQYTEGKDPSDWAQRAVISRGGPLDPDVIRSDTPNINPIMDTDRVVTGEGVRGAVVTVEWKNGAKTTAVVDSRGRWVVRVPSNVTLVEGDIVTATQKEVNKLESLPAHETVNGDTKTGPGNDRKSDTPDIDDIFVGDTVVTGSGTPGSEVTVRFKNGATVKTIVGPDGRWSVNAPVPLALGDKVNAMQTTPGKTPSDWAQRTVISRITPPNQSDTPNVNPINEGDKEVSGKGIPDAEIVVTWPDGSTTVTKVEPDGEWKVKVPDGVELKENDIVTVVQTEPGKDPSIPHHVTVGGGDKPGDGKSDTPNINEIFEGDTKVSGEGTPGSEVVVRFPNGKVVHTVVGNDGKWSVNVPDGMQLKVGDEVFALQSTPDKQPSDWAQRTVIGHKVPSDKPEVNPITEGDRNISGKGKPGGKIIVTWPDGSESSTIVDDDGNWNMDVPPGMNLGGGDRIGVVQYESGKGPSERVEVYVQRRPVPPPTPPGSGSQGSGRSGFPEQPRGEIIEDEEAPLVGFIADHIQYIRGYPEGDVRPDNPITRAETAEIIYRLLEASRVSRRQQSPFPDVGNDEWYTASVSYLASIDIVRGYLDGTFRPDNPITRAEFATMISGFDNLEEVDYNVFPDVDDHWAKGYINSAATKGWVAGYLDGMFRPEDYITRAEVISVVNRMLNRKIEVAEIPSWAPSYTDITERHWAYADVIEASIGHRYERKPNEYEIWTERMR
ncbi:MAG: Ig-like domain-containing protein [Oscillospiraceae bacterium]|nr:Ig-like domain-containing protein [Oscillospiraceae bacterium]